MIFSIIMAGILNLGEIVKPDMSKTIGAFATLIAEKKRKADKADEEEITKRINLVLRKKIKLIDDFKLGKLSEYSFTTEMIKALQEATKIRITELEFDEAWNTMNPNFKQFEGLLRQAIEYNSAPNQKIIFISFTNPKDMRHLIQELKNAKQSYVLTPDKSQLTKIDGITLYTTYGSKKNKIQLIETIIKELRAKIMSQSNSSKNKKKLDIKYIRGINNIKNEILRDNLDGTNQQMEKKLKELGISVVIWEQEKETLSHALAKQSKICTSEPPSLA